MALTLIKADLEGEGPMRNRDLPSKCSPENEFSEETYQCFGRSTRNLSKDQNTLYDQSYMICQTLLLY